MIAEADMIRLQPFVCKSITIFSEIHFGRLIAAPAAVPIRIFPV